MPLDHRLDSSVAIRAPRELVFSYFTDSARWANWWGAGSTIEPRPGGPVLIVYPGGIQVAGEVLEVSAPERIVFTYGFVSGTPIPAGSSRVTIRLEDERSATRVHLTHEFADEQARDHHVQGWRYQLSMFANVVSDEVNRDAAAVVDAWFGAWAETDAAARDTALRAIAEADVHFCDRYSNVSGIDELVPHIGAAQHYLSGVHMRRTSEIRHCQGTVLADFSVAGNDGKIRGRGTNVFVFASSARIASATGFMSAIVSG